MSGYDIVASGVPMGMRQLAWAGRGLLLALAAVAMAVLGVVLQVLLG